MNTTGFFKKSLAGLAVAASLGTATVASIAPAEAGWHHGGHHGGGHHAGWHHGARHAGWHHGGGWHHGWAGPRFYHHGWGGPRFYHPGYRPIGLYHAHRPCLRRVFGPWGSHLVRVC